MSKFDRYALTGIIVFVIYGIIVMLNPMFDSLCIPIIAIPLVDSFFQKDKGYIIRFCCSFVAFIVISLATVALTIFLGLAI